jgi:hypothetical protein
MIEIDSAFLLKKESLKIRFTGAEAGSVGILRQANVGDFILCDRGIALEVREVENKRSAISDNLHWFRFKAKSLGPWAKKVCLSEYLIRRIAEENPELVCNGWPDVLLEGRKRHDFKRARRPLVAFLDPDPCIGIIWEVYPALGRLGVYIGRDDKGLGGYVHFYDFDEFKVL